MARFRYRMQSILELKMKMETQAKLEFSIARNHLDEEENKLDLLFKRKGTYEEEGRLIRKQELKILKLRENELAIKCMDEYIETQKQNVLLASEELEKAREKLQEVIMERKTHEKLREHAFEEYMLEENRSEGKEVDELTSYTYGQRMG